MAKFSRLLARRDGIYRFVLILTISKETNCSGSCRRNGGLLRLHNNPPPLFFGVENYCFLFDDDVISILCERAYQILREAKEVSYSSFFVKNKK